MDNGQWTMNSGQLTMNNAISLLITHYTLSIVNCPLSIVHYPLSILLTFPFPQKSLPSAFVKIHIHISDSTGLFSKKTSSHSTKKGMRIFLSKLMDFSTHTPAR